MKLLVLQLAALGSAFLLPNEQVSSLRHVEIESSRAVESAIDRIPSKSEFVKDLKSTFRHISDEVDEAFEHISDEIEHKYNKYSQKSKDLANEAEHHYDEYAEKSKSLFEEALEFAQDAGSEVEDKYHEFSEQSKDIIDEAFDYAQDAGSNVKAEFEDTLDNVQTWAKSEAIKLDTLDMFGHHGHHGHHGGHHGQHKPNLTVYQLISKSKYTTKLAKLIDEYDDLVEALNGTAANYTVFAPTDTAFKKLPKHHKPSKKVLKEILSYHVSPEFFPAARILASRTIPTLYKSASLGKDPLPQRLSTDIGLGGLYINYITHVVAVNIYGTNGVIHGVDSFLFPPPIAVEIIDLIPSELSTLELGLIKTGLFDQLNTTKHQGGTMFAPDNHAFAMLGHKINAFLFSQYGKKYLKALLEYHIAPHNTLYSDAFYKKAESDIANIPKGFFHADLPTLLEDRSLSVDIARYGRLIDMKINAFSRVSAYDVICADGVIHVVGNVLIPPKKLANGEMEMWTGEGELTEEDLKERLEPFVVDDLRSEEL